MKKEYDGNDEEEIRDDKSEEKRVELHAHTKMSKMRGLASAIDLIEQAIKWGHKAIAITDTNSVQAFPEICEYMKKREVDSVKVICGVELKVICNEQPYNSIILVKNATGLKNLYKIVSLCNSEYENGIQREIYDKYSDGLIIGLSTGNNYIVLYGISNKFERANKKIEEAISKYDFIEINPIANLENLKEEAGDITGENLEEINDKIVRICDKQNKPVIAASDSYYINPDDKLLAEILESANDNRKSTDNLYFRTTEEMLEGFKYLGEEKAYEIVVINTNKIANMCQELKKLVDSNSYSRINGEDEAVVELATNKAYELYGNPLPQEIQERLDLELNSIVENKFSAIYMIANKLVKKSNEDGYLVGNRGSIGSSFVAYLLGITETNPLPKKYKGFDIPFETLAGINLDKEPDIDLNFAGEYQEKIYDYLKEMFGKEKCIGVGTIGKITEKTALGYVESYFAKKDLSISKTEIKRIADKLIGVKRQNGRNPGKVIIVPEDKEIYDFCPVQSYKEDDGTEIITTHFEYYFSLSDKLLSFDLLGHNDPTFLRYLQDLTGINPRDISLDDKETLKIFSSDGTTGIPEFGTKFTRKMLLELKPVTFEELIKVSALSHSTRGWEKNAQMLIKNGVASLSEVISSRDDIMLYLLEKGMDRETAFKIMERIRKGKGLDEEATACMIEHNVPDWYIESCNKIMYVFPKAHAVGYTILAFRVAWYKVHYPKEFYIAYQKLKNI